MNKDIAFPVQKQLSVEIVCAIRKTFLETISKYSNNCASCAKKNLIENKSKFMFRFSIDVWRESMTGVHINSHIEFSDGLRNNFRHTSELELNSNLDYLSSLLATNKIFPEEIERIHVMNLDELVRFRDSLTRAINNDTSEFKEETEK